MSATIDEEAGVLMPFDGAGMVQIACENGTREVPALTHPLCPGLAVTMAKFGAFRVTHTASGMVIGGEYERWGSAALEMAEWTMIARALGFSWEEPAGKTIAAAIKAGGDRPVPFSGATPTDASGTRPMTVMEWVQMVRGAFAEDEFPWEDESPADLAWALIETMAGVANAEAEPAPDCPECGGIDREYEHRVACSRGLSPQHRAAEREFQHIIARNGTPPEPHAEN